MTAPAEELPLRVEALLFAGGKPLAVREIVAALGLSDPRPVQQALRLLARSYSGRRTALEMRRVGDRYALQLREEYVATARSVTPMEMSPRTLKALTLVAYHQPMLQSLLVRMIGDPAYGEVQRLRGMGLLRAVPKGSTLELSTTRAFSEYFGISSTRPEEIRQYLAAKLGPTVAGEPLAPASLPPATSEGLTASPSE